MADRRRIHQLYDERSFQEPGMVRHGHVPGIRSSAHRSIEQRAPTNHVEATLATQLSELEKLAGDNRMLSSSHVALREDLVASQREIQKLRGYIRSIETEGDIQIRVLLEKIAKMEVDLRGGESIKKEYLREHMEAQSLVKAREDLKAQIQQKTKELEKACADVKMLPDMHAELDALRQEHQRLRTSFQYEKGLNVDKVKKMQVMEKELMGMVREVEMLRVEVSNAENRAHEPNPYRDPFMHSNIEHAPIHEPNPYRDPFMHSNIEHAPIHGNGPFAESYGIPHGHQALGAVGAQIGPHGVGGSTVWGRAYDAPLPPR